MMMIDDDDDDDLGMWASRTGVRVNEQPGGQVHAGLIQNKPAAGLDRLLLQLVAATWQWRWTELSYYDYYRSSLLAHDHAIAYIGSPSHTPSQSSACIGPVGQVSEGTANQGWSLGQCRQSSPTQSGHSCASSRSCMPGTCTYKTSLVAPDLCSPLLATATPCIQAKVQSTAMCGPVKPVQTSNVARAVPTANGYSWSCIPYLWNKRFAFYVLLFKLFGTLVITILISLHEFNILKP